MSSGDGEERIYGLEVGGEGKALELLGIQAAQKGLMLVGEDLQTVTVNTPEWKALWQKIKALKDADVFSPAFDWEAAMQEGVEPEPYADDPFMAGKAAMSIKSSFQIMNLDESMMMMLGVKERPFNWDIVTIPVQADRPNAGGMIYVNEIVVINKNTPNLETAKDFVNYISSDEVAKVKAESNTYAFIPRADYVKQQGLELNYEAFYKLEPIENMNPLPTELTEKYQAGWNLMDIYQKNFMQMYK